jgi:hypothetical protein
MAERRMFAKQIIDSDAFLDMPTSSQALYFHLGMRGDDEGFVNNPKKILRMIGSNDDDMKILISKNFIIPFDSGVCVIKHWKIHNYIRADRLQETVYQDERKQITIKNNDVYSMSDISQSDVGQMSEQVRLGKVRLGKVSKPSSSILDDGFNEFWDVYPKKVGKEAARKSWIKEYPKIQTVLNTLRWQIESDAWQKQDGQFIPNPATYINQGRWADEPVMKGNAF